MDTRDAIRVLRDLANDDLIDGAQRQAIKLGIAALDDVARREKEERDSIARWKRMSEPSAAGGSDDGN